VSIVRCEGVNILSESLCSLTHSKNVSFLIPVDDGIDQFQEHVYKSKRIYIVQNTSHIYKSQHFLP
jgi:hypothetical protein